VFQPSPQTKTNQAHRQDLCAFQVVIVTRKAHKFAFPDKYPGESRLTDGR